MKILNFNEFRNENNGIKSNESMKRTINEEHLGTLVAESVKRVLSEMNTNDGTRMIVSYTTDEDDFELYNNAEYDLLYKSMIKHAYGELKKFTATKYIFEEVPYNGFCFVHCDYVMDEAILLCVNAF